MNVVLFDGAGFSYGVFASAEEALNSDVAATLPYPYTEPTDAPVNNGDGGWD